MEEQRRECDKRRVMLPRVGGGPVTLIALGGALAVAGLVAAFSFKKRRNSIVKEEETARSCRKDEEESDGLRFVLHQSSSPTLSLDPCSVSCETPPKTGVTQIDDCITGNLMDMGIMEEKDASSSGEYQEILLSDSEKESIVISNDGDGDAEDEFSVPILENMAVDEPENVINITNMAPSNMKIEDEAVTGEWMMIEEDTTEKTSFSSPSIMEDDEEAVTAEEETSEQCPSSAEGIEEIEEEMNMKSELLGEIEENHYRTESSLSSSESEERWPNQPASTEEEDEEDEEEEEEDEGEEEEEEEEGEEVTEESEESEEEGGSSTETNEAIWPAEMVDASSAGHRKTIINYQNSGESLEQKDRNTTEVQELISKSQQSSDCYRLDNENRERSRTNNKEAQELVVVVHEGKHLIRWQIALCSVVLPLLLLLLLTHWIITPKYSF